MEITGHPYGSVRVSKCRELAQSPPRQARTGVKFTLRCSALEKAFWQTLHTSVLAPGDVVCGMTRTNAVQVGPIGDVQLAGVLPDTASKCRWQASNTVHGEQGGRAGRSDSS